MCNPSERARRWQTGIVAAVLAPSLTLGAPITASGQDEVVDLAARAYPVAIHEGTCNELLMEPSYDLGLAQPRPMIATDDDTDDDGVLTTGDFYADDGNRPIDENTVLLTGEDFDSDGIADFGFDLNENDVLDADEVFERPIIWSVQSDLADLTSAGDDDDDDIELEDLREVPHAVVVHASAVTGQTYLSCGEIEGVSINDEVVVPLLPVTENGLTGVAIMETGENGFLGVGGDAGLTNIHLWPRLNAIELQATTPPTPTAVPSTPTPESTATPQSIATPEPTVTPESTATPEPTATPDATATPQATATPDATATPQATATPEPTATPDLTVTPVPPTNTPVPPTPTPELTPTPEVIEEPTEVIELPTEVTIEVRDADVDPPEFTIWADTDTEFILVNLTLEPRTFFIEGAAVTQEVPAGESVSIVVNAPVGAYVYGLLEEEALTGTLHVIERAE